MTIELFTPAQFSVMPWKNGTGSTLELYREPSEGIFTWRLSIATITASGPFSVFDGYERFITALTGEPITLHLDKRDHILTPLVPYRFDGEQQSSCTLSGTAATDFNLIVSRDFGISDCKMIYDRANILENHRRKRLALYAYKGDGSVVVDEEIIEVKESELLVFTEVYDAIEISCSGVWIQAEVFTLLV